MENSTCQCFPTTLCVPSRSVNFLGIRKKKLPLSLALLFSLSCGGKKLSKSCACDVTKGFDTRSKLVTAPLARCLFLLLVDTLFLSPPNKASI